MEELLSAEKLKDFQRDAEVVFAREYGKGVDKRLTVTCKGRYRVYQKKVVFYETSNAYKAVSTFKSI